MSPSAAGNDAGEATPDDESGQSFDRLVGQCIDGRYQVLEELARGGMGVVYKAQQNPLGRMVALKVLNDRLLLQGGQARLLREAAVVAQLKHPHTVVVHDYGQVAGELCYIAMELLEGRTLAALVHEEGALDPARVVHMALQICGSVAEAHDAGLVHRDLKPSNVMLVRRGEDSDSVKVLDFGLVKQVLPEDNLLESDPKNVLTHSGEIIGSPVYMSPEQVLGQAVDARTDIYQLGGMMYFALTGRPPFVHDTAFSLLQAHVQETPPRLREASAQCVASEAFERIVMRCLHKEPAARYPSATALADALRAIEPIGGRSRRRVGLLPATLALGGMCLVASSLWLARSSSHAPEQAPGGAAHDLRGVDPKTHDGVGAVDAVEGPNAASVASAGSPSAGSPRTGPPVAAGASVGHAWTGTTRSVRVVSRPAGAKIHRGDEYLGTTPVTVDLPADATWMLRLSSPGFAAREVALRADREAYRIVLAPMPSRSPPSTSQPSTSQPSTSQPSTSQPAPSHAGTAERPSPTEDAHATPGRAASMDGWQHMQETPDPWRD